MLHCRFRTNKNILCATQVKQKVHDKKQSPNTLGA